MFQLSLTAGSPDMSALEIATLFSGVQGVLIVVFFIVLVIAVSAVISLCIKKKNADHGNDKHS